MPASPRVGGCGCREPCHRPWPAPSRLADLNVTADDETSMIARCGPPTHLRHGRSRAELAGATRPLRHRKGRRDPDAATRGRRAAPHQPRPKMSWLDRAVLGALSGLLPPPLCRLRLVSPRTLLRRHAQLVARRWTYLHRRPGRPSTATPIRTLVLRLAREDACRGPGQRITTGGGPPPRSRGGQSILRSARRRRPVDHDPSTDGATARPGLREWGRGCGSG